MLHRHLSRCSRVVRKLAKVESGRVKTDEVVLGNARCVEAFDERDQFGPRDDLQKPKLLGSLSCCPVRRSAATGASMVVVENHKRANLRVLIIRYASIIIFTLEQSS